MKDGKRSMNPMDANGGCLCGHTVTHIATPAQEKSSTKTVTTQKMDYSRPSIKQSGATPSKASGKMPPAQWPPMSSYS